MDYQLKKDAKILIISGATASGKSALALKIAKKNNGAIVNADSMQLYSELPILSAQPSCEDLNQAPHFLYSVLKHNQNSSLSIWLEMAIGQINNILDSGQLPIVVGGTGLHLSKLITGINYVPNIDENLKIEIRQFSDNIERKDLIKALLDLGENLLAIENLDKQRLTRRLEVLKQTGKSLSWWQMQPKRSFYPLNYFDLINVELPRDQLYLNCNSRLKTMFENGVVQEVERLINLDPSPDSLVTKTIGYEEIKNFLQGKISQDQVIEIASQKTRNYAKRQLTWFRNQF